MKMKKRGKGKRRNIGNRRERRKEECEIGEEEK